MAKKISKTKKWVYAHFDQLLGAIMLLVTGVVLYYAFLWGFDHSPTVLKYHKKEVEAKWGK